MKAEYRRIALGAAAIGTFIAAAWVSGEEEPAQALALPAKAVHAEARAEAPSSAVPPGPDLEALKKGRGGFPQAAANPFAVLSWAPPAAAEKPAPPAAPPLPYTYFGRMTEGGKTLVFLQRGERSYTVSSGEVLDNTYRIENIGPDAIVITYLPLKQRQVLHTGS